MAKPWDVRPPAAHGDRDDNILLAAVGRALTEWERIEASCAELFAVFVSARGRASYWTPAIQAYGSIVSFNSRCDMLRAAAVAYFQRDKRRQKFGPEFNALLSECLSYSGRRNEIAHGQVSQMMHFYEPGGPKAAGYYLLPSFYNPKKFKMGGKLTYHHVSNDLIHYRRSLQNCI